MARASPRPHEDKESALSQLRLTNRLARVAVVAMGLGMLGLASLIPVFQAAAVRESAEINAHRAAQVVATQFHWMFQAAAQALQRIDEAAQLAPAAAPVPADIAEAVRGLPVGLQHSLYDVQGRLVLTSVPRASQVNVSDRPYFLEAAAGTRLIISPMVTERLTGEKVFVMARRIERDGKFAGVATIAIPIWTLEEIAQALELPEDSTVSLVHADGMMLARAPAAEPMDLSDTQLFHLLRETSSGTYSAVSPVDGSRRIVGFWRLEDWNVIAVSGQSEHHVFEDFNQHLITEIAIVLVLASALFGALVWLTKMQARDELREAELLAVNRRNDQLLREIHHRVKNNLQTVSSLIRLEDINAQIKAALLGRISAMAAAHQEMYGAGDLDTVELGPFLRRIVWNVASGFGMHVAVDTDIVDTSLRGERALQLGLVVNELVSNAFKHAFGGRNSGRLWVALRAGPEQTLILLVSDDGPGSCEIRGDTTLGKRLVAAFVTQLGGTMRTWSDGGLHVEITFPVSAGPLGDEPPAPVGTDA